MLLRPSTDLLRPTEKTSARSNFRRLGCRSNATPLAMRAIFALIMAITGQILPASAHAYLDHANPAADSSVTVSPSIIKLWFTGRIQHAFSGVTVMAHDNRRVDLNDVSFPVSQENELDIGVNSLPLGTYTVHWHVLAIDGHSTEGSFKFTVSEPR